MIELLITIFLCLSIVFFIHFIYYFYKVGKLEREFFKKEILKLEKDFKNLEKLIKDNNDS